MMFFKILLSFFILQFGISKDINMENLHAAIHLTWVVPFSIFFSNIRPTLSNDLEGTKTLFNSHVVGPCIYEMDQWESQIALTF